jgi:hypothetical protein
MLIYGNGNIVRWPAFEKAELAGEFNKLAIGGSRCSWPGRQVFFPLVKKSRCIEIGFAGLNNVR